MTTTTAPRTTIIKIEATLTDETLMDVLTTAVEGGINYWASAKKIERDDDLNVTKIVGLFDKEDGEAKGDVDLTTVANGIEAILSGKVGLRSDLLRQVYSTITDDMDVDADAADCIVQAGLFGEVVYG